MKLSCSSRFFGVVIVAAVSFFSVATVPAQNAPATISPNDLASRLSAVQLGSTMIRTRMEMQTPDGNKRVLQLQIKERRTKSASDLIYVVLWPKERKGEAVILHQDAEGAPRGTVVASPGQAKPLDAGQMDGALFGSDLSYQDAVENFFAWKNQAVVGSETVDGVECQILESKPDKAGVSIYGKVRSWIDLHRLVPLRVEKYSTAGKLMRRVETTRVARDQQDRFIPGNLTVRGPKGTATELNGARIEQGQQFTDRDFTPEAIPQ